MISINGCQHKDFGLKNLRSMKSKMISMIASNKNMCAGHAKRLEWVERIGDQVDLYGRGFNEWIKRMVYVTICSL